MSKDKKTAQLGMSPSTASGRLVKDILFDFVEKSGYTSYHCGEQMTRETFSIEHKVPWLDSEDPVGLFFALDNIHYSHLSCNARAARRKVGVGEATDHGITMYNKYGCRCDVCKLAKAKHNKLRYKNQ